MRSPQESTRRDTVLVVDDTPENLGFLTDTLDQAGFTVLIATDGLGALELVDHVTPDLVLMDAVMPGLNGFETCRRLKREKMLTHLPVIFMTGLSETEHVVEGLSAGGVDYVTKPIVVDELLARIRATLRRAPAVSTETVIEVGAFRIDIDARSVTVADRSVRLTPKEFELLVYLARHPGKILTHRVLLSAVWGGNYVEQVEYLRVFIGHLRKKIEPDPSSPRYIMTEPWTGYRFEPGPE